MIAKIKRPNIPKKHDTTIIRAPKKTFPLLYGFRNNNHFNRVSFRHKRPSTPPRSTRCEETKKHQHPENDTHKVVRLKRLNGNA